MEQLDSAPSVEPTVARLRRSRGDRVIAGVCGGLGRYFKVDPVWFRLAFIVLAIGGGSGVVVYLVAWLLIPEEGASEAPGAHISDLGNKGPLVAGAILVGVGLILLANNLMPWFDRFMWPAMVIVAGAGLLYTGSRRERN
ncbi:MAG TPA: PspC domain-containing protein [Acidimicrobiia bacterium]|nr:PspC domain-containing protein [Acidimicrobiia bacterium]